MVKEVASLATPIGNDGAFQRIGSRATFHTRQTICTAVGSTKARSFGRGVGFELMSARELAQQGKEPALIPAAYAVADAMLHDVEHRLVGLRTQFLIIDMFGHERTSGQITPGRADEFPSCGRFRRLVFTTPQFSMCKTKAAA